MHPAAEDNYGYDACAILCLPCVPNILVIATESGMLYHCVVLEGEEEDDQTVSQPGVCAHLYLQHLVYILYQYKCLIGMRNFIFYLTPLYILEIEHSKLIKAHLKI